MDPNHRENLSIEVNESGVVAVYGEIAHAPLLQRISPAIVRLDEFVRRPHGTKSETQ